MIATAVAPPWKSGSSRSAKCPTREAKPDRKTDMGEPSEGLVVPDGMRGAGGAARLGMTTHVGSDRSRLLWGG
ncbi:hypothetical protein GCM10011583_19490 [Streptomyces camponoticapitis]|uniref:Uncharacterized protein n=1 Tax=Streptomyces camponoticapitis TaxID=1616125 RepID=A0ABQ2E2X0_9ACTN|nr:hypothetical protein GCM10011583_19490 [Streptomyces camponoticapitis]